MPKVREPIPPLTARTSDGRVLRAWDYRQKKNLVIAFLHTGCRRCEAYRQMFVAQASELTDQQAAVLIILLETPSYLPSGNLPPQVIVATDTSGRSHTAFLGPEALGSSGQQLLGVFVVDRYGELCAQWILRDEDALPGAALVLEGLRQIQAAAEECG